MIARSRRSLLVLGAATCAVLVGAVVLAQGGPYTLAWYALGSGGGSTGGGYTLNAVLGQPNAATSTGGGYVLTSGAGAPAAPPTPTEEVTPDPRIAADAFEPDDTCPQARPLTVDALAQEHTFHRPGDADWVVFPATQGAKYRIEAEVPASSRADVVLEVYEDCGVTRLGGAGEAFTIDARLVITALATGSIRVRVTNTDSSVAGANVRYRISVKRIGTPPPVGAVIIVAGRNAVNDDALPNTRAATERAFKLFQKHGYNNDNIYVLSNDPAQMGYDAESSLENLKNAITKWAPGRVSSYRALTIYMMDHGDEDKFYLDLPTNQVLTPKLLAGWLQQIPADVPVNIIIEACHSGSFIEGVEAIGAPNRVVITSTDVKNDARTTSSGAIFSDYFFTYLAQGRDLYSSFRAAREQVLQLWTLQDAWLDANGNRKQNENEDRVIAAQRGFQITGSLPNVDPYYDVYPPTIAYAVGPDVVSGERGVIQAQVLDNKGVVRVWAAIYPPSYAPPPPDDRLAQAETLTTTLTLRDGNYYVGDYARFTEPGFYRIVVNAVDEDGLLAEPAVLHVLKGEVLFLPSVAK